MSDTDKSAEDDKKGMIGKRVLIPLAMWSEIMHICRRGGIDHRDVLAQLLELGLQAQDEGRFKPRFVQISAEALDRVAAAAKSTGLSEDDALVRLVDIGIQARSKELARAQPVRPKGTPTKIELGATLVASTAFHTVPAEGEVLSIGKTSYVIEQRAWSVGNQGPIAYLRVKLYPGV